MTDKAIEILDSNRIMAVSTVRSDGWPQTTFVGYANEGLVIYCVIFRASQKFANISRDGRVSIAVGKEPPDIRLAQALYAGAQAGEVTDPAERDRGWQVLARRHANLSGGRQPDWAEAAMIRAECLHLSVLDYTKGLGHTDALHLTASKERSDEG